MTKLCQLSYVPQTLPPFPLKLILAQFVYSRLGAVNVFETDNPHQLEYYGTKEAEQEIQDKANTVMPKVEAHTSMAVYEELFLNNVFFAGNLPTVPANRRIDCATCTSRMCGSCKIA